MESKILKTQKINAHESEITTKIYKKNGSLTLLDVKNITKAMVKKGQAEHKHFDLSLIRILNGDRWATFTSEEAYLEYYQGKVKDVSKFMDNVMQMQVITYQTF